MSNNYFIEVTLPDVEEDAFLGQDMCCFDCEEPMEAVTEFKTFGRRGKVVCVNNIRVRVCKRCGIEVMSANMMDRMLKAVRDAEPVDQVHTMSSGEIEKKLRRTKED